MANLSLNIEWDPAKAASNLRKHGVSFADAAEVLRDPLALTLFDEDHSEQEARWITLGQVKGHRLVVVVHTWRDEGDNSIHVRIISARHATARETQQYQG